MNSPNQNETVFFVRSILAHLDPTMSLSEVKAELARRLAEMHTSRR